MNARTFAALLIASLMGLGSRAAARADGEAGLVIQDGDLVQTYCVPFKGDSISGADLLDAAGVGFQQVGGASRTVCSIGSTGCHDAGDFASCFCQCQGADCTYWAFFTEKYGQGWVYASLAFNVLRAKDGDLQGWKWGKGNPNSAPSPPPITFETVCGHAPDGGLLAPTLVASPTARNAATASGGATPSASASAAAEASPQAPSAAASVATLPATGLPSRTTVALASATAVKPPATGKSGNGSGGGVDAGFIAFGAIAAGLVLAIGGAIAWRQRHGA